MDENGLVYIANYDARRAPGIHRKVEATLSAARSLGYNARNLSGGRALRFRDFARAVVRAPERVMFVRHSPEAALLMLPLLAMARFKRRMLIVDVPTPSRVAVLELWRRDAPMLTRLSSIIKVVAGGPYALWPASRIIQYADESVWFALGNRHKTVKLGNGANPAAVSLRPMAPPWPAPELKLVAVATLTFWHGYDRLIRAIAEWSRRADKPYEVSATLIGDGRARQDLERMARESCASHLVRFTGLLGPEAIQRHYTEAHLAVGSLGLHRKGLMESAELKAREYALAGIPFIASGDDPDFPPDVPFRVTVGLDEGIDDLLMVFEGFGQIRARCDDSKIRAYAETLSFENKLRKLGLRERR